MVVQVNTHEEVVVVDHQCYVVGSDGNAVEPGDTMTVVAVAVAAPEGQNSARNENRDWLDYTYFFQCKLYIFN